MNYYQIFNLETKFIIDLEDLEKRYIELQKKHHPDSGSKSLDIVQVSDLNMAYRTLKNDYQRACFILKNNFNLDLADDLTAKGYTDKIFLLDLIEEIETLEKVKDLVNLTNIFERIQKSRANTVNSIARAFEQKIIKEAAKNTVYLKYYDNLIEAINKKIEICY